MQSTDNLSLNDRAKKNKGFPFYKNIKLSIFLKIIDKFIDQKLNLSLPHYIYCSNDVKNSFIYAVEVNG